MTGDKISDFGPEMDEAADSVVRGGLVRFSFWRVFVLVLLVSVLSAGLSWLVTYSLGVEIRAFPDRLASQEASMSGVVNRLDRLSSSFNVLNRRLHGVEERPEHGEDKLLLAGEMESLWQEQAALDERLQAFREALLVRSEALEVLGEEVVVLRERLDNLEQAFFVSGSREAEGEGRTLVGLGMPPVPPDKQGQAVFASLREAVEAGEEFPEQIALMKRLFPRNANVQALVRLAGEPTLGREELKANFLQLQEAWGRRAEEQRRSEWGWHMKLVAGAFDLRSPPPPGGDEEILQAAARHLRNDDLDASRLTVSRLSPEAQISLSDWRAQVDRRLELDRHIRALRRVPGLQNP